MARYSLFRKIETETFSYRKKWQQEATSQETYIDYFNL